MRKLEGLKRKKRKLYRLILRASEALMNAYTNSEDVSFESRILELSRAFEILFKLPEKQQRKVFKSSIKKYCEPAGERIRRYLSERPGNIKVPERGSRQVMWADRFYTLRNHIIHGESENEFSAIFRTYADGPFQLDPFEIEKGGFFNLKTIKNKQWKKLTQSSRTVLENLHNRGFLKGLKLIEGSGSFS